MTNLTVDWIEAVGLLRGPLSPSDLGRILEHTSIRWGSRSEVGISIASITYKPAEGFTGRPRKSVVLVNPRIEPLYRVERIEGLMRVAIRVWQYYAYLDDYKISALYNALGVAQSPLYDPKVRWNILSMKYHKGMVAASKYEDRPVCPICKIHVSTGHTSPKIHDGCLEYFKNVYTPALKAQQSQQKQEDTKAVML
jgi:hypothetical protein